MTPPLFNHASDRLSMDKDLTPLIVALTQAIELESKLLRQAIEDENVMTDDLTPDEMIKYFKKKELDVGKALMSARIEVYKIYENLTRFQQCEACYRHYTNHVRENSNQNQLNLF